MSVEALEPRSIRRIQRRFPDFKGELPVDSRFWSEADLEKFFESNGTCRPTGQGAGGQGSSLLSKLRLVLAERGINGAPTEYQSVSRHFKERSRPTALAGFGTTCDVRFAPRGGQVDWTEPALLLSPADWPARAWNLEYIRHHFGGCTWQCLMLAPGSHGDQESNSFESVVVDASVHDYIEYVDIIAAKDARCKEENQLAYPRMILDNWPFLQNPPQADLFLDVRKALQPAGIEDCTMRWLEIYRGLCDGRDALGQVAQMHPLDMHAAYYRLSLAAPGCVLRLHRDANAAHLWLAVLEGSALVALFRPDIEDRDTSALVVSTTDVLYPTAASATKAGKVHQTLLRPGRILTIPAGWWWYFLALQPTVLLRKRLYNGSNPSGIVDDVKGHMQYEDLQLGSKDVARELIEQFRLDIDEDSVSQRGQGGDA